jgi:hypothetical protein
VVPSSGGMARRSRETSECSALPESAGGSSPQIASISDSVVTRRPWRRAGGRAGRAAARRGSERAGTGVVAGLEDPEQPDPHATSFSRKSRQLTDDHDRAPQRDTGQYPQCGGGNSHAAVTDSMAKHGRIRPAMQTDGAGAATISAQGV